MDRDLLRSIGVNSGIAVALTAVAVLLARRAEYFGDLVFIAVMMYSAGFLFLGNLVVAAVQAWRKKEWKPHLVMAPVSLAMMALLFFLLT